MFSSENLYDWQNKLIVEALKITPFGLYGQTERLAMAAYCEYNNKYHIVPEYGIVELIDENGQIITTPNQVGEIVATGFGNYAMPFIRYRTGDLASFSSNKCICGRSHRILSRIDGRTS